MLAKQGLVKKTYGGAIAVRENPHLYSSNERKAIESPEREVIADKAVSLIKPGMRVYLDCSVTSIAVSERLVSKQIHVTVITNMISVLNVLTLSKETDLIFIGGSLNPEHDAFTGTAAQMQLSKYQTDLALIGAVGINAEESKIYTYREDDGLMKETAISNAKKSYVLAESGKFSQEAEYIFARPEDITGFISSDQLDESIRATLNSSGLEVL